MAQTAELLLAEIAALPKDERAKLLTWLKRKEARNDDIHDGVWGEWFDSPDPEPSMRWMNEHRAEYANQYVALLGDQLIAHSTNAREVIAAVHAGNFNGAFFARISPPDEPVFAGF